jgi:DNA-binding GntR family transcriptional regulator
MRLSSLRKMISHESAVPVYRQLAGILRGAIGSGQIAAGAPLPSESSLMQEYGISRDSVRKAMDVLRAEGLVITVQGKGSFAAEDG